MYNGHFANIYFMGAGPKKGNGKRKNITKRGVKICDDCLQKYIDNPDVRVERSKK